MTIPRNTKREPTQLYYRHGATDPNENFFLSSSVARSTSLPTSSAIISSSVTSPRCRLQRSPPSSQGVAVIVVGAAPLPRRIPRWSRRAAATSAGTAQSADASPPGCCRTGSRIRRVAFAAAASWSPSCPGRWGRLGSLIACESWLTTSGLDRSVSSDCCSMELLAKRGLLRIII